MLQELRDGHIDGEIHLNYDSEYILISFLVHGIAIAKQLHCSSICVIYLMLCHLSIAVLVGTHALLSETVVDSFNSLGLVVIDEEQRFGVKQRALLATKAKNVLYTTATPIPR
jgi:hypothetical protein